MAQFTIPDTANVSGEVAATAQRLRYTAGNLRHQANNIETCYHELIIRVANLRRDADLLDARADDLDTVWKEMK